MMCSYCPQNLHVKEYTKKTREVLMSLDTFELCLSKIPKHVDIIFAGMAEPFLNKQCADMMVLANNLGYKVGVYTTGVGVTASDIAKIKDINFLYVCLHVPDGKGDMKIKIDEGYIDTLKMVLPIVTQKMCIGKIDERVKEVVGDVIDGSVGLFSRAGNLKSLAIPKKVGVLGCSACGEKLDHNILLPNGEVLLCCMDYGQESVLGNLTNCTYDELFNSEQYKLIQQGLKDDSSNIICRRCEISKLI